MKTSRGNGMKRLNIFIDETGEFGFGKVHQDYMVYLLFFMIRVIVLKKK